MIIDRSSQNEPNHPRLTNGVQLLAGILYVALVSAALLAAFSDWSYDDPFITYRYAENLQRGMGFVYNPGERVLSTTTPLFTLLLAIFSTVWADIPRLAVSIGAISLAIGALALWDLARTWRIPRVGWVGIVLYPTYPLVVSTLSSETPLYLAFLLLAFASYARANYSVAAFMAALGTLTRPDGALVAILLAADYLLRVRRPIPWRAIGLYLTPVLFWVVFAWAYFGSPIPTTLVAKRFQGALPISQSFAEGFLTIAAFYARRPQYLLEAALAVLGGVVAVQRPGRWQLFLVWPLVYFVAYSLLGVTRYFWYYAPLIPGFLFAAGFGLRTVIEALGQRISTRATGVKSDKVNAGAFGSDTRPEASIAERCKAAARPAL